MEKVLSSTLSGEQFVAHVNDRAEHLFGLHFKRSEFEEWLQWDVIPKMCRGKNAGQRPTYFATARHVRRALQIKKIQSRGILLRDAIFVQLFLRGYGVRP